MQTFKDFELLIIDDGSTDNTEEIISEFKDARIRYIKGSHLGRSQSLNVGLNNASNEIIALKNVFKQTRNFIQRLLNFVHRRVLRLMSF